jgi:hypothetical protein
MKRRHRRPRPVQAADPVPGEPAGTGTATEPRLPTADPDFVAGLRPIPTGPPAASGRWPAADLAGEDPGGRPVALRLGEQPGPLLLCFLTPRCDGCHQFWSGLADPPGGDWPDGLSLVAVTRGAGTVDPVEVAGMAAGAGRVPVVMSDRAWTDYRVTGYPFFILVDPAAGTVVGETVGFGWSDVRAMVGAALEGPPAATAG